MEDKLPSIVITGASGFIGRFLLDSVKDEFSVFAIARRSRKESNVPYHKNIHWIQCDIANEETLNDVMKYINDHGGADFVIHLAAFYDFSYKDHPEYQRTNVEGTLNILRFTQGVKARRFIFASSLAACNFPDNGARVTETTPPDADYHYARAKKAGEEFCRQFSEQFPCTVARFAAVYSDWCEYAPLYKFLETWLSRGLYSRFLAGRGESAIPYIHVQELVSLLRLIMRKSDELPRFDIYSASPDGSVSHKELYNIATSYYFGSSKKPFYLPKLLAYPGLVAKHILNFTHIVCGEVFERLWLVRYIDEKLDIDASYTRQALGWEPAPRYHITRRLLFLLEKMKSHPDEWRLKNEAAMQRFASRTNLIIYEALTAKKEYILPLILERMKAPENDDLFGRYKKLDPNDFQCYISTLYHLLMATVRSGDRGLMIEYIDDIALRRFAEGFLPEELRETLSLFKEIILRELSGHPGLKKLQQELYDYIGLTLQLAQDEVEDLYDKLLEKMPREKISESSLLPDCKKLQRMIRQLSAFYQISPEEGKYYEELQNE